MMGNLKKQLIDKLSIEGYKFRGAWFLGVGMSLEEGKELLISLKNEGVIDFEFDSTNNIDYGTVKLVK